MTRPCILVVDDDPLFRSLLRSMLHKEFRVSVASDGAEGYYMALERPPDLAIVDIRMPGWDGLKTLNAFRTHHQLNQVPVMMLTSDASRQSVMAALQAGASDYVIKTTLSREDFMRKVCRQLKIALTSALIADAPDDTDDSSLGTLPNDLTQTSTRQPTIVDVKPIPSRQQYIIDDDSVLPAVTEEWD